MNTSVVCLSSGTYISLDVFQFYVLRPLILEYDTSPGLVYFMQILKLEFIVDFGSLKSEHTLRG